MARVFIVGVGMTKFQKPGSRDYPEMAKEAITKALNDARISKSDIGMIAASYVYGDSTCGQRAIYEVMETGVPIVNVNNNCSSGSSGMFLMRQAIIGGVECAMAVGFEKMQRGSLTSQFDDRTNPMDRHVNVLIEERGIEPVPVAPQLFGAAGLEHMDRYGTRPEHFAKIAVKNHRHSVNNPYSQFRDEYSLEQVLASPKVYAMLTKLQCCPTSDGAAAVILASEGFVVRHHLEAQAVEIAGMGMATDFPSTFNSKSCINMVGFEMTKQAAKIAYSEAGINGAADAQVLEVHDCFSANEAISCEALGMCPVGGIKDVIDRGDNTYGGKWVVNPSGGLISKGHPLGATGLAQACELSWQLRKMAGLRQVPGVRHAISHNVGLGGACVVGVYRLGWPALVRDWPAGAPNPATDPEAGLARAKL